MTTRPDAGKLEFSEIEIGRVFTLQRVFGEEDVMAFAGLSGDFSPLHVDPGYAGSTEFGERVVHGMLLASLFSHLVGMQIPGENALYLGQDLVFRRPVFIGERVTAQAKVTSKNESTATIVLATEIRNAEDKVAVSGTAKVKVRGSRRPQGEALIRPEQIPETRTDQKVVVVTGASRGIGAAIAQQLASQDYQVVVNYRRSSEEAERVVESIRRVGGSAVAIRADVTNADDLGDLFRETVERLGDPVALVNGAIGGLENKSFLDLTWRDFQEYLDTQVRGVVQSCQAVYPYMKRRGGGSIINILSQVVGGVPPSRMTDYVTAKYALLGLSKALAAEWANDHIRVNMISPSLVRTTLTEHFHERVFRMESAKTPLRRLATPHDVAKAVAFLMSEEASFLTGVNLFLTGGQFMQ